MINYELKYLKYKNKYLELEKTRGGDNFTKSKEIYKYNFDIKKCSDKYWDELMKFLDIFGRNDTIKHEEYKRITDQKMPDCTYNKTSILKCKRDEFFFKENTKQIILGRYADTAGCFFNCTENYFVISITPYSIFKNDLFIKYGINYFNHFTGDKLKLEKIFPIRILLSDKNEVPYHEFMDSFDIKRYYSELKITDSTEKNDTTKSIKIIGDAVSQINKAYIEVYAPKSLKEKLTTLNKTNVLAREMCILFNMNLYFYYVDKDKESLDEPLIEPYILVSKFNLVELKEKIKDDKIYSRIKLLYHK